MKFQSRFQKNLCNASICSEVEIEKKQLEFSKVPFLDQFVGFSKITANPNRAAIVYLLFKHKALCVCDIANILEISIASASQHLRKMSEQNLVCTKKEGLTIFYALCDPSFIKFLSLYFR